MKTFPFPLIGTFYQKLQKFQQALDLNALTPDRADRFVSTIAKISKKIFANKALCETSYIDDIAAARENVFASLQTYERERIEADASLLREFEEIATETDLIGIQFDLLSPLEIEEKCHILMQKWQKLSKKKAYNSSYIAQFADHACKKILHLQFRLAYPILEELSLYSYHRNFAKDLLSNTACLSAYQRKWVDFYAGHDAGSVQRPALEIFYSSLVNLVQLAEGIYTGDGKDMAKQFQRLSKTEKEKIQTLLWKKQIPDMNNLLKLLRQNDPKVKEILSYTIMEMVEQLVM